MAAEEVPLPEEMQPNPPEALARQIMEGLPQPKGSPFDFITKLFAKKEKELPTSVERGGGGATRGGGSKFPHRSAAPAAAGADNDRDSGFANHKEPGKKQREEDHSGTSNRLRALAKNPGASLEREGREAQSTTRSLGEKLGFAAPAGTSLTDEQPLTLAESIRRKVSETKPDSGPEEEMAPPPGPQPGMDDGWGPSPAGGMNRPPANLASPPVAPKQGADNGQTVLGTWGKPTPIDSSNNWGGGQGAAPAQAPSADDWGFDPSAGGQQQMGAQGQAGGMDPFAAPNQQGMSNPNIAKPSGDSWGGWNDNQAPRGTGSDADSDWGPPPQGGAWDEPAAANNNNANNWGGTPNPIPNASAQPQPKPQPQFNPGVMETGMIKLGELGLPSMQQQQQVPGGAPGAQPGQQNFGAPAQNQGQSGGQPAFGGQMPGQAPQPVPGNAADPWGGSNDNWGTAPSQDAWGAPNSQGAAAGGDQWGQPNGQSMPAMGAQAGGMGGAQAPGMGGQPANMGMQPGGMGGGAPTGDWGQPTSQPAGDSWGAAPNQNNWGTPGQAQSNNWDSQPASPQADAQSAWGDNDWGASQPQQQQQAPQQQAPAMPEPAQTSSQAAALGKGRQQAWSLEAEQVETGTWRAFAPAGETLSGGAGGSRITPGPTGAPNQQSFAPQPQDDQSRWDVPIQERMKQSGTGHPQVPQTAPAQAATPPANPFAQPSFGQPAPAAVPVQPTRPTEPAGLPDSPAPTKSGWNFPVYEAPDQLTNTQNEGAGSVSDAWGNAPTSTPEVKSTGGWDMPSANPSFGSQPMQAPAAETKPQSPWDVPIQERQQQPQPQSNSPWGQAPEAAPAANPAQGNAWGQPAPAAAAAPSPFAAPQNAPGAWDNAPAPAAPAAGGWDSPTSSGWGDKPATSPGGNAWDAPAPAPSVAGSWGTPGNSSSGWGDTPAVPVPAPAPAAAQPAAVGQAGGQQGGGLFQNLDDSAIDRLFSENLGVNDNGATGAAAASAPAAQAPAPQAAFSTPRWNPGENAAAAPAAPTFSGVAPGGQMGAAPSPFAAPQPMGGDSGAPKISAITPRGPAPEAPAQPGMDRRTNQFGAPPMPAPQPVAEVPPPAPVPAAPSPKNGLFNLDDSAMDELFSRNLGINESATPATSSTTNAPAFQQPAPAPQQPPTPPANPFSRPAPQLGQQAQAPAPAAAAMQNPFAQMTAPPAQPSAIGGQPPQPSWGAQPPAPLPAQAAAAPGASGGLFSIDDSMIDKIFADNVPSQPTAAAAAPAQFNVNEAVKEVNKYAEVAQVPPPKIAGVGRLDPRMDTSADSGSGRIASIGKFLLDQKDLEKIGKLTGSDFNETKMRILTMEAAQELQTLLHHIGTQETVVGSVIVGHDGLLIANTMPSDIDAESIGVWALGLYMSTEMVIKKMGQDRVHQIVSRTPKGYVVIADFGGGLLVTVSDGKDTDTLIPLMRSITQLVAQ